jgi:lipopolysaccharide biosynthesis regulator YciM
MAKKARKFVLKDFTLTGMIDKTESVYRELLERHEARK